MRVKTDVYTLMNYSGVLKLGKVTNLSLSTEVDTSRLKTTGNDAVYGSKYFYGTSYFKTILPVTTATWALGTYASRWKQVHSEYAYFDYLVLRNPAGSPTDTGFVKYDGSKISFGKPLEISNLNVTTNFQMDSAASLRSLKIEQLGYIVSDVKDSVVTLDSLMSNVLLGLPGNVTNPGIETIDMAGAAIGHIVIFYTTDVSDSILFRATQADGNIYNATNFYLKRNQNAGFMLIYDQPAFQTYWMCLWVRKN